MKDSNTKSSILRKNMVSLIEYMQQQGINITPLPKVKMINNDEENAADPLGTTAYYQPDQMCIVLFTKDRHPKDILRSFSHEMIHHHQNVQDRLGNVSTTNVNEDEHLHGLELEAYSKGNMLFREWENSCKGRR